MRRLDPFRRTRDLRDANLVDFPLERWSRDRVEVAEIEVARTVGHGVAVWHGPSPGASSVQVSAHIARRVRHVDRVGIMVPFAKRRSQRARPCTSRRLTGSYRQNRPQGIAAAYLVVDMIGDFAFAANSLRKDAGARAELVLICPHLDCELREAVKRIVDRRDDGIPRPAAEVDRTADDALRGIAYGIALLGNKVTGGFARLNERERAFAQVPHADVVVVPNVLRVDRNWVARAGKAVVRGDHRVFREERHLHPHGRDAVRVPSVDFVGK